jgi:hypothetical protein
VTGESADPATRFGELTLTLPDGRTLEFALDQPTVNVGRASENHLILDDTSVSRRHARLTIESGNLYVEDLGSAHGTFVAGQRLAANTPAFVTPGQVIRLGEVVARYTAPPPIPVEQAFVQPAAQPGPAAEPAPSRPAGPTVNASLIGPSQPVAPGSAVTATLTLQNRSLVVDELSVRVENVPAEWVRFSQPRVSLLPGAQQVITVSLQPPRSAEAREGEQVFTLVVTSAENGSALTVAGSVRILPFHALSARLEPVRGRRDFTLHLDNQGNAPVNVSLTGTDDEKALDFQFSPASLSLPPGVARAVPLRVKPRARPGLTTRETRGFTLTAAPAERAIPPAVTPGQLMIRPAVPGFLLVLAALILLAALIGGGGLAYVALCPAYAPDLPFCPGAANPGGGPASTPMQEPTRAPTRTTAPPPPAATPTRRPTNTPPPPPNPAVGTFETTFEAMDMVYLEYGPSIGSQAACVFHPITLAHTDVGKTLTVRLVAFELLEGIQDEQPDTRFEPDLALYRSLSGGWSPEQYIDLYDRPVTEIVVGIQEGELQWSVSQAGDYVVCLQVAADLYYSYPFAFRFARYRVLLGGN